ncbi:HipA domain-containing protein [Agromyces sp. ISL-38]|uniref:HipA domain-containing protein n=1 Tax=Agromyces sp. ISL-38 TaxID=2819107 RepID=UPI001BEC6243|nr:HipA domain-containing protein [Agromyces sp. ISL-38]MBT2499239.1 HipA domain-containing protein [Agromyces sp. ISL-38]MBT2518224.1 HipA domain-containing protein [Streptomyces sp. ISL-90]
MPELAVELYGQEVGRLVGADWRRFDFETSASAIERFGLGSTLLSTSVPLVPFGNRSHVARRRNFFAELLPEGDLLTDLAAQARLPEYDVLGLLAHYGRDVAGALQVYDPAAPGEPRTPFITPIDRAEIGRLLRNPAALPLGNDLTTGKTSLNGVQPKVVLARIDDAWHRVHDGYPSTHILKPEVARYPTMIFDEAYGARIARALDLIEYDTWIEEFGDIRALVIERYDRSTDAPTGRVHQEDMCQALGVPRTQKYQEQGGAATLDRIHSLVRSHAGAASVEQLARMVVLAVAIGNVDLHAKNLALLHPFDAPSTLAPAYDTVPLRHQPNDGRMAFAVNAVYRHADITVDDLEAQLGSWSGAAGALVRPTLEQIAEVVEAEAPHPSAHSGLRHELSAFVSNLLGGASIGSPATR